MNYLEIVEKHKDQFKHYEECHRIAEILEERKQMNFELFNSWYSKWFIFLPVFIYKSYQHSKKLKILDLEFYLLHRLLTRANNQN